MSDIKSITIVGKRWFDKTYGNTYCSSRVYVNGELLFAVPWTYGYDRYYEQKAIEELIKREVVKLKDGQSFFQYRNDNKIKYETIVTDGLKREMVTWGVI